VKFPADIRVEMTEFFGSVSAFGRQLEVPQIPVTPTRVEEIPFPVHFRNGDGHHFSVSDRAGNAAETAIETFSAQDDLHIRVHAGNLTLRVYRFSFFPEISPASCRFRFSVKIIYLVRRRFANRAGKGGCAISPEFGA